MWMWLLLRNTGLFLFFFSVFSVLDSEQNMEKSMKGSLCDFGKNI